MKSFDIKQGGRVEKKYLSEMLILHNRQYDNTCITINVTHYGDSLIHTSDSINRSFFLDFLSYLMNMSSYLSKFLFMSSCQWRKYSRAREYIRMCLALLCSASADGLCFWQLVIQNCDYSRKSSQTLQILDNALQYRTRVRSLVILVTDSLTDWFWTLSKLDWCDPGMWRYQLKICWGCDCYCCWCW